MALNTHVSQAFWNAALAAGGALLNGGYLEWYTGVQPATPDTALSGNTLLGTLTIGATAFTSVSGGTATAGAIGGGTAVATGTVTWFRAYASNGTTAHVDGSVGTATADMIVATTTIQTGAPLSCSSWTLSMPVAQ